MQTLLGFINTILDPLGIVIGLILAIPVFWTWYQVVFGAQRQQRRWLHEISVSPGVRPVILILDLLPGKNIRAAVEQFRQQDAVLKQVPPERIFTLSWNKPLTPATLHDLHQALRRVSHDILNAGTDRIHYFHAGPVAAAASAGAEFANGAPVVLYQYDSGLGIYQRIGAMQAGYQG
jgi:hypothetical protein